MKKYLFLVLPLFFINSYLIGQEADSDATNEIEEVVVTATSRETNIFEVPYNISAISGSFVVTAPASILELVTAPEDI